MIAASFTEKTWLAFIFEVWYWGGSTVVRLECLKIVTKLACVVKKLFLGWWLNHRLLLLVRFIVILALRVDVRVSSFHVNVVELPGYELVHDGSRLGDPGGAFVGAGSIRVVDVVSIRAEAASFRDGGYSVLAFFLFNGTSHFSEANLCRPFSAQIVIQVPYLVYIVVCYSFSRHAFLRSFVCIRSIGVVGRWCGFFLTRFLLYLRWTTLLLFFRVCFRTRFAGTQFAIWLWILIDVLGCTASIDGVSHYFAECWCLLVWCIAIHFCLWFDKWELFFLAKAMLLAIRLWTNTTSNGCLSSCVRVFFVSTKSSTEN